MGREAFWWNGSRGHRPWVGGPAGRNTKSWNGLRAAKSLGEVVRWRCALRVVLVTELGHVGAERPNGSNCFRAAGSTGWWSSGHRINGWNAWKRIGSGGVRRALRSAQQGLRVQAPGVSIILELWKLIYIKPNLGSVVARTLPHEKEGPALHPPL